MDAPSPRYPLLQFLKMEAPHLSALERTLRATERLVAADLRDAARRGGGPSAQVSRMQLETQRAVMKSYIRRGFTDIERVVEQGQEAAARSASLVVSRYESTLTSLVVDADTRRALATAEARRAAASVQTAMRRIEGNSYVDLSQRVYKTSTVAGGYVDTFVNTSLARNLSWTDFARQARSLINPDTPGGVTYAARRLARTEINNAFHASAAKRYAESGLVDSVDWNKSSSHPENDICDTLAEEGPYPIDQIPTKPHPHCFCFLTPALPSEEEFLENLFKGKYDSEPWAESADRSR